MTQNVSGATAILLAGGKSLRMGTDKGLMPFNDKPMILHAIGLLMGVFPSLIIISNDERYHEFGFPVFKDEIPDAGPAGGIVTGLIHSPTDWNFVMACDLPYMNFELITLLRQQLGDFDAVVPYHDNLPEPLCAFYNKSSLAEFRKNITNQKFKIQDTLAALRINKVDIPTSFFSNRDPFTNINSAADIPPG
jgi:molybdenum cofactor guanylyltransferase